MIRFEDPWLFIFFIFIPLMIVYQWKGMGRSRVRFSSLDNLKRLKKSTSIFLRYVLLALRCLAIALLVMALARPQSGTKASEVLTEGIDIILCLDTSGSMQALDFKWNDERQNRLQVVKKVVSDFIKGRKNDRIGMVVFGEEAFTQCPLTLDYGVILSFLDQVEIGMAGDSTAIGSALGTCVKRLKELESKSKVVILLTDGRNNAGGVSPGTAADIAKTFNIKTYTIGVGTEGEVPFLVDTIFGKKYVYQRVDLDEDTLKEIAEITGGKYFRATNTRALEEIYKQIDKLEKTKVEVKEYMEYKELFGWFLLPGLACILLEIILSNTRFKKIP
ncbi:MAG: VWA domain-containing protein [Deltaproteobacteria bacterium]|nr:VWA domain-containing protein [Deltaproteobacteria bacterium]